ncbi:MAG: hypothetical protein RJA22_1333 [Verrucomicrobiota bacterium]
MTATPPALPSSNPKKSNVVVGCVGCLGVMGLVVVGLAVMGAWVTGTKEEARPTQVAAGKEAAAPPAPVELLRPFYGIYEGRTPAYPLRDKEGEIVYVFGKACEVPAVDVNLQFDDGTLKTRQESADGTVVLGMGTPVVLEHSETVLKVRVEMKEWSRQLDGAAPATPTYTITFQRGEGALMHQEAVNGMDTKLRKTAARK